ncbi:MAG: tRNA guanosine(34) transglycosylase Tgt [Methanotrichaceae archaeon]|nr:tRNA guanosine(34) transglycosylase Tgt [Methanotrichaceae archaeon]
MTDQFSFRIIKEDRRCKARLGTIGTKRGHIQTPCFVPVATFASVRALDSNDLELLGAECALANTYHLHQLPGDEVIRDLGGLHRFMSFPKPIFSDSGGFQAFSLGLGREHNIGKIGCIFPGKRRAGEGRENLTRITDEGIAFKCQRDGARHWLDAKKSMAIQSNLGSDIVMAFDECTSPLSDYEYIREAMERSHRWGRLSLQCKDKRQAIYGVIHGGWFEDLRRESTDFSASLPFDGLAIGGSLGQSKEDMHRVLDWVVSALEGDLRPRHLLGIGGIDDIFEAVGRGMDTLDCVNPTRIARRGGLYISPESGGRPENHFRIPIKAARFRMDDLPIDPRCSCPTCQRYSRAYLRHLFAANELSYYRLASIHNLHFVLSLMRNIQRSIGMGCFQELKDGWLG